MPPRQQTTSHRFPRWAQPDEGKERPLPRWPLIGIFLVIAFYFIAEARSFLMPATLAFLLFFVFVRFTRWLGRRGIRPTAAAAIVTLGLLAAMAGLGYAISGPIGYIASHTGELSTRLETRLGEIRENFRGIEEAAAKIDEISQGGGSGDDEDATAAPGQGPTIVVPEGQAVSSTVAADGGQTTTTVAETQGAQARTRTTTITPKSDDGAVLTQQDIKVQVDTTDGPSTMQRVLTLGPEVAGQVIFTLVLLFFLIASGDLLYLKIVQSFDTMKDKRAAYLALREVEDRLGTYLGAITIVNAGLGLAIGLAMWAWGMPSPLLWGVAGFVLNYIPYIGAIMGTAAGVGVGLLVYPDLWSPMMIGLTFLALTSIEGQFVTPYFVSRRLQLNEVVVFLFVALWAWLWSILGMIVAVPLLVVLRVLADHIPGLEKFGNFLAGEDPPALEDEDEDEAREIVEEGESADSMEEAAAVTRELAPDSPLIPSEADRVPGSRADPQAG